jgi:hypothetical protein
MQFEEWILKPFEGGKLYDELDDWQKVDAFAMPDASSGRRRLATVTVT